MIYPVSPWKAGTVCPLEGFEEFKNALNRASYHNAAEQRGEAELAHSAIGQAAAVAIEQRWPIWAIARMFDEVQPLVEWNSFLQIYINAAFATQSEVAT
jgi:hypothetical protein